MRIYVASSWQNERQPEVVDTLRAAGHRVYDFRRPAHDDAGFHWSAIDPNWKAWTPQEYRDALQHPLAFDGYGSDLLAMEWANVFVGVQPFGRSASMEMGWAAGKGRRTILLLAEGEPELMVKMFDYIALTVDEVITALSILETTT